jgi:hypothetical protein
MSGKRHPGRIIILCICLIFLFQSCAALQDIASQLLSLQRLQFRIGSVHNFRLLGIDISNITAVNQFSFTDAARLIQGFKARNLAADFILDLEVRNPNNGTGGTRQSLATLSGFESRLLIDDVPTVTGNIENPVDVPGTGSATVIPIRLSLNLYEFFVNKGYDGLINLVLALGGANRSPSRLALDALPRVNTPWGVLEYPNRITVVSTEFR